MEFTTRNVGTGLTKGLKLMNRYGVLESTRNGEALVIPEPVLITYERPWERVLLYRKRDANPFFHLMEALWMLAGRRDVKWISQFTTALAQYSDNGKVFHGAYGYRWRQHFNQNQLATVVAHLREYPESRRAVLTMWDPMHDLNRDSKDLPCNTHIYFSITRNDRLSMTVCNRSNDMVWGTFGANYVHFSMLQEVLAAKLGVMMGNYRQFTNNLHMYTELGNGYKLMQDVFRKEGIDPYENNSALQRVDVVANPAMWFSDLGRFMQNPVAELTYHNDWFATVAQPMAAAWFDRKAESVDRIQDTAWRQACRIYLENRT